MTEVLNCDADGCGHVEPVARITAGHVGMPCPKCGESLLTEADWQAWKPIQALLLAAESAGQDSSDGKVELNVRLHGDKTTVEITKPKST